MSLNNTPSAERLHIGIFGKRNAGKSSVINALTGQNLAIVSDIKGTTTDPVLKSMELLPLGPVVIIDTPGLDDDADVLGALRIQKAYQMLNKTDIAILVIDGTVGMTEEDKKILTRIQDKKIPYIVVLNKADLAVSKVCLGNQSDSGVCKPLDSMTTQIARSCQIAKEHILWVSAQDHSNIQELKELIGKLIPSSDNDRYIVRDLIRPMDLIVLVVPIDSAAPKGRLILPQQQTIRDILDCGATAIVTRDSELEETLKKLGTKPSLVITDSQAFAKVSKLTPADIPLTSFSILFAQENEAACGIHAASFSDLIGFTSEMCAGKRTRVLPPRLRQGTAGIRPTACRRNRFRECSAPTPENQSSRRPDTGGCYPQNGCAPKHRAHPAVLWLPAPLRYSCGTRPSARAYA